VKHKWVFFVSSYSSFP